MSKQKKALLLLAGFLLVATLSFFVGYNFKQVGQLDEQNKAQSKGSADIEEASNSGENMTKFKEVKPEATIYPFPSPTQSRQEALKDCTKKILDEIVKKNLKITSSDTDDINWLIDICMKSSGFVN